jgi:hypothetical protein
LTRSRALLAGEPGRIRMGCLDYMQVPEVPFHERPAFSHSLGDLCTRSGRLVRESGDLLAKGRGCA